MQHPENTVEQNKMICNSDYAEVLLTDPSLTIINKGTLLDVGYPIIPIK